MIKTRQLAGLVIVIAACASILMYEATFWSIASILVGALMTGDYD